LKRRNCRILALATEPKSLDRISSGLKVRGILEELIQKLSQRHSRSLSFLGIEIVSFNSTWISSDFEYFELRPQAVYAAGGQKECD